MPKVPIYTAEGSNQLPATPGRIHTDASAGVEMARHGLVLNQQLAELWGDARRQAEDLEFSNLTKQYDAGLDMIHVKLSQDKKIIQQPWTYHEVYLDEATKVGDALSSTITNGPHVTNAFANYKDKVLPGELTKANAVGLKILDENNKAALIKLGDTRANELAVAGDEERTKGIADFGKEVDRLLYRDPVQAQVAKDKFEHTVLDRSMKHLAANDPGQLRQLDRAGRWDKLDSTLHLRNMERAQKIEEDKEKKADADAKRVKGYVVENWVALANFGEAPEQDLQAAMRGEDPFLLPSEARKIWTLNRNPHNPNSDPAIEAIMLEYHSGNRTFDRINKARKDLGTILTDVTAKNPKYSEAFKELQHDWDTARSINAAELTANQKAAIEDYKSKVPPALAVGPLFRQMQRNQAQSDLNEINKRVRSGEDRVKIVDEIIKRNGAQDKGKTDTQSTLEELLK